MMDDFIRKCPKCGNVLEKAGIKHLLDPPHTYRFLVCRKCCWHTEIIQKAIVKKVMLVHERIKGEKIIKQDFSQEIVYTCEDLSDAASWADEHKYQLASGNRFDIYYRYEET